MMERYKIKRKFRRKLSLLVLAILALMLAMPVSAVMITKNFSGLWRQTQEESQGFDIQVIDQNGSPQVVVYWYTYDTAGNPMWLTGLGDIEGNEATIKLRTVVGPTNLQPNNPEDRNLLVMGDATFSFESCDKGTVDIQPSPVSISGTGGAPSSANAPNSISGTGGIVNIARLTSLANSECTGGITDNIAPGSSSFELSVYMQNTGAYPNANAKYEYELTPTVSSFDLELEDVPVGSYALFVGGIERGQIEVVADGGSTEGDIEFDAPALEGENILDFDPRDQVIEIYEDTNLLFYTDLNAKEPPSVVDPVEDGAPPFGNSKKEVALINSGFFPNASGEVELEQRPAEVNFSVKIEDLDAGSYSLYVDDIFRGTIEVTNSEGGPEGELEFRYPAKTGKELLDFDPRGKNIAVMSGDLLLLDVDF